MIVQAEWLPILMRGAFNDIFVIDSASMQLLHINEEAYRNLGYAPPELLGKPITEVVSGLNTSALPNADDSIPVTLDSYFVRKDGTRYPSELRIFRCDNTPASVYILIGRDLSQQRETAQQLGLSKSLFSAIVSNTPGLVYQFQLNPQNQESFTYLSEGCQALLGLSSEQLRTEPELFVHLILPDDRASYHDSMATSSRELKTWNWEGRIWIDAWKDIKWINLRATPHQLPDKGIQWNGIMTNITQSKLEEFEIKHSRARLAELSAHIENVKELERTRIAREVHDDLGGNLTAIKMALAMLAGRLPQADRDAREKISYVEQLVDRTIDSARRIASDLRPSILDFGIVAALEWQTEEFEKQLGIPCHFASQIKEIELPADHATAVFRIFQEALTNIAKHAEASQVHVNLSIEHGTFMLKIIDNGKGVAAAERLKPQSFGIRGMVERAHTLGGKLSITPTEGGGCTVTITIPQKAP